MLRGRFYVYGYDEALRLPPGSPPTLTVGGARDAAVGGDFDSQQAPSLPLPPLDERIQDGRYYLVAERVFALWTPQYERLNWRALVELQTGSVLYLRALSAGVNGMVFVQDPISATGNAANDPNQGNAVLNPLRSFELLQNLEATVGGVQQLRGTYADLQHVHLPNIDAPTQSAGNDFDYDARSDEFAAVNAYYHTDGFFSLVESLGFFHRRILRRYQFPDSGGPSRSRLHHQRPLCG